MILFYYAIIFGLLLTYFPKKGVGKWYMLVAVIEDWSLTSILANK